jgi:hypothetical protein
MKTLLVESSCSHCRRRVPSNSNHSSHSPVCSLWFQTTIPRESVAKDRPHLRVAPHDGDIKLSLAVVELDGSCQLGRNEKMPT